MNKSIIAHSLNGVTIGQRSVDGFINGTAICVACGKDISDWLKTDDTLAEFARSPTPDPIGQRGMNRGSAEVRS